MRAPKLNALKVFDAAARHLNFRLAAVELNVTQGAIAQQIRGLEADLEVALFRRMPRGVALTTVGEAYHEAVARGLAIIDAATAKLHSRSNAITVSVPPSFASKWLVPKLPYFFETNVGVQVTTIASEAVADLRVQDVDIAVRQGPRPTDKGLLVELLTPSRLCVVCGLAAADHSAPIAALSSFADLPLIQDGHRHWERIFGQHGIDHPASVLSFNQTALAMDAAAAGQGFAVVPRLLASDDLRSGRLIEVWAIDQETSDGFWLVQQDEHSPNQAARIPFVEWIRGALREDG